MAAFPKLVMSSSGAALLIVCVAFGFPPDAEAQRSSPFRNTSPNVRYVGAKVCSGCHPKIFSSYIKTGMGRSMLPAGDVSLRDRLPTPATIFDKDNGQYIEVFRQQDGLYQTHYALDRNGKEIFRQTFKTAYVVGSGENGFGVVIKRDNYLFEAPLSYYTKSLMWSFSPGYEIHNYAFNRPVVEECIGCHSGRPRPVSGGVALYRDPPFTELAVGCENCHGPGEIHIQERQTGPLPSGKIDTSIVNPAHLNRWLADNICMKCHQGGDVRVEQPGKTGQDFRPGVPLGNTMAIFKVPLSQGASEKPVLLEHYFSMTLSKCYRASASRLRCGSCHDPHSQPSGQDAVAFYRSRCLGCHQPESCTLTVADRLSKSPADDCASCHMPKRTVTSITHAALTDHTIAAHPGQPYPEEAFESHTLGETGLLCLTATPGESASRILDVTLLRAYLGVIRDGHKQFTKKKNELLDRLANRHPENAVILAALARRAASESTTEGLRSGIRYLAGAVRAGSTAPEDFLLLGDLYARDARHDEAIRVLEKGRELSPYFREFYEAVAVQEMELGKYRDALETVRQGLRLFPDDTTLRLLEKNVQAATIDDTTSK
jgi:hypothetical protein